MDEGAGQASIIRAVLVSHTHWDREWYRPFEAFRGRLVDTIDQVLDQLAADPGWSFLLDGQTVVLEDYLAIRPGRRSELEEACRAGRLAIGPWYVQPDSLLPSGEAHVRNLLEGRRVGETVGPVSSVGYTPDSFGHPGQLPQILAGVGLRAFVYWRGNGSEIDRLPPVWRWVAPDGTALLACHLAEGYFAAAYLGDDVEAAAARLEVLAAKLHHPGTGEVLLMNGLDHAPPDSSTAAVAALLAERTGWEVRRGLLDDHVARVQAPEGAEFTGELIGGRVANLLPGVWSTRLYLKARNRACQSALEGWAEPWAAWGQVLGLADERPALRLGWRSLLVNQAHDSICGCSTDLVHDQMIGRYDTTDGLAAETTGRVLERLSGLGPDRRVRWDNGVDVAVWNPSPHARTDVVRFAFDGHPVFMIGNTGDEIHGLILASVMYQGITVDGAPARVVPSTDPGRVRMMPEQQPWDVELVAEDIPAFGWRRYRLAPGPAAPSERDAGRRIAAGDLAVEVDGDGTFTVSSPAGTWTGLLAVEDTGDRGDTYDFDPVEGPELELLDVEVSRARHVNGIEELAVRRRLGLPAGLAPSRDRRSDETAVVTLETTARLVPGTDRVDVDVAIDNTARDHRLRLLFPVGAASVLAATTFDAVERRAGTPDDTGWMQPAQATFPHQGWVAGGGLAVAAPDLPEAELTEDGVIALTLVRAVGWLSGMDLHTRPLPAGPGMPTPGAQCLGWFRTRLHLWCGEGSAGQRATAARDAELGLRAVVAGPAPLVAAGQPLLGLTPASLLLSAVKPAEDGEGMVVRVVNPSDEPASAELRFGIPVRSATLTRLDEVPAGEGATVDGATVTFPVRRRGVVSVRVT